MGWADGHIARLGRGETVRFRPRGHSMTGKIESGQLCTVEPLGEGALAVGDIVLCRVKGNQYLHLVKAIQGARLQIGSLAARSRASCRSVKAIQGARLQIGNNRGGINGWITRRQIFGRLIAVEP